MVVKVVCAGLMSAATITGILFFVTSESFVTPPRRHSMDSIIKVLRTPYYHAHITIACLQSGAEQKALKLQPGQLTDLQKLLQEFDQQQKVIWQEWRSQDSASKWPQPFEPPALKKLLVETEEHASARLQPAQRKRLQQLVLRRFGTDALFLPRIQQKLRMSNEQCTKFYDLSSDRIRAMNEFDRELRQATKEDQLALLEQRKTLVATWTQQLFSVLSDDQREQLDKLLGPPLPELPTSDPE